jgi:RHS repeat-associated protein
MNAKLAARNVSRVVTREESGRGQQGDAVGSLGAGNAGTMFPIIGASGTVGTTVEGGALAAQAAVGGTGCTDPLKQYTATRFEYAKNGEAVTYAMGEQWCSDGNPANCPTSYNALWAREFRYDGARSRYMNRQLNPSTLATVSTVWSDYDGNGIYGDFTVSGSTVTNTDSYQPGLWRKVSGVASYLHNDVLGTLRQTTGTTGAASGSDVFTAFGERQAGSSDRFGYVGAWGYQDTLDGSAEVFPYLYVGARYYDPSSGRFLQRDPIGAFGGLNVYAYVLGLPTRLADPFGLYSWGDLGNDLIDVGGMIAGVGSAAALIAGGAGAPGPNAALVGVVLVGLGCAIDLGNRHLPPPNPPDHFPFCDPYWGSCPPDTRPPPFTGGHRW